MRQIPLNAARLLGLYASFYRFVPALYLLVAFVITPAVCLGISAVFDVSIPGGIALLLFVLAGVAAFEYMWVVGYPQGNALCYKVLSEEQRNEGRNQLEKAN